MARIFAYEISEVGDFREKLNPVIDGCQLRRFDYGLSFFGTDIFGRHII